MCELTCRAWYLNTLAGRLLFLASRLVLQACPYFFLFRRLSVAFRRVNQGPAFSTQKARSVNEAVWSSLFEVKLKRRASASRTVQSSYMRHLGWIGKVTLSEPPGLNYFDVNRVQSLEVMKDCPRN